jgi:hypothetical protein
MQAIEPLNHRLPQFARILGAKLASRLDLVYCHTFSSVWVSAA